MQTLILESDQVLQCPQPEHEQQRIIRVCTHPECNVDNKLLCGHCILDHADHHNKLINIKEFIERVNEGYQDQLIEHNEEEQGVQ